MFRSKKLALALAVSALGATAAATTATGQLVNEAHTVKVPGYVPAFFVGPVDDGDPSTQDMKAGSDSGIRNLQVTLTSAADARPSFTTIAGGAAGCAQTAMLNQSVSVTTARAAIVKIISEWDEVKADGTVTHRVQEILSKTENGALTRSVPICVN